jgi:hypothetical protein
MCLSNQCIFCEGYTELFTFRKDVFMPGESSVEVQL